jgi:hypothetical protein
MFRAAGDGRRLSAALSNLGALERQQAFAAALPRHAEALELLRLAGDRDGTIVTLVNLGLVAVRLGREREAGRHVDAALALVHTLRARRAAANALEVAAEVLAACGRAGDGARLLGAASALRSAIGLAADTSWRRTQAEVAERLRASLGAEPLRMRSRRVASSVSSARSRTRAISSHERSARPGRAPTAARHLAGIPDPRHPRDDDAVALLALAALPGTSRALKVCDTCVDANNDTTFTPAGRA